MAIKYSSNNNNKLNSKIQETNLNNLPSLKTDLNKICYKR